MERAVCLAAKALSLSFFGVFSFSGMPFFFLSLPLSLSGADSPLPLVVAILICAFLSFTTTCC